MRPFILYSKSSEIPDICFIVVNTVLLPDLYSNALIIPRYITQLESSGIKLEHILLMSPGRIEILLSSKAVITSSR